MTNVEIFKELKKGIDFYTAAKEHNKDHIIWYEDDAYDVISDRLGQWCERSDSKHFSDLIVKIKIGNDTYTIYAFPSFCGEYYRYEFVWDWYEGEETLQILAIKRIEDVFEEG